ncbi:MAG TPA: cyclic nucleotide-binding domain-containing protein [Syntrophorhabdaceae bacterium]|nr:cyclic nucleotide-binding domain-containing protein [Syntrophorhabdaceae bacterium]HQM82318.1 cyclic nucleotide-binding domain-containing protein [Syntrophorhabdaceae bacterium]
MKEAIEVVLHLIKDIPFFDCFTVNEIGALLEGGSWIKAKPDSRVVTQGETDFRMFILVMGRVDVVLNEKVIAFLSAGDIFGEVGLMGAPRMADVVTKTECLILTFSADQLNDLPIELQLKLIRRILLVMVARLQKLNVHEWLRLRKTDAHLGDNATKAPPGDTG